jgi:hypothetical protein
MNTQTSNAWGEFSNHQRTYMLTEVDFKWLMAGIGIWIDPSQLHLDPDYAQVSLQNALRSNCEPLRRCAVALKTELEQESLSQS